MSKLNPLLRLAAISGAETALALHIRRGDDLDARDASGSTPLILAATRGKKKVVKLLLEAGADPTIFNLNGKDALACAVAAGCDETVTLLSEAMARLAGDKTKISETSPAEYMVSALVDDPAPSLSTHLNPATLQTAHVASDENRCLTTVSFKVEPQETEDLGSRLGVLLLDEAPLGGEGLDNWEAEVESIAPQGDESIKDTAIQLHKRIGRHKAVASDEDWGDIDLYLPDRVTPLDIEGEGEARMLLLGALREGFVLEGALEEACFYLDGTRDEEAERLLSFVVTELGATIIEWLGKDEPFQGEPTEEEELLLVEAVEFVRELTSGQNNPFSLYSREIKDDRLDAEGEKILGREMEDSEAEALKALARWPGGLAFLFDAADRVARGEVSERDFCATPERNLEDEQTLQEMAIDVDDDENEERDSDVKHSNFVFTVSVVQAMSAELNDEKECVEALRAARLTRPFLLELARRGYNDKEAEGFVRAVERLSVARNRMILCNLRLALYIAKKYQWSALPLDDLIQEANIGLVKAVDRFDWHKGFRFSTYATWWIRQQVMRAIADKARVVRIPAYMWDAANKVERQRKEMEAELGGVESEVEAAERFGMSLSKVRQLQSVLEDIESLDEPDNEVGAPRVDLIMDSDDRDPALVFESFALHAVVLRMLEELDDRSRAIVTLRFGLGSEDPLTLEEVGQRFGVTRERIRQIESKAMLKLSHKSRAEILAPFLGGDFSQGQHSDVAEPQLVRVVDSKMAKESRFSKVVEYKNKFSPQSRKLARLALRQLGKDIFER